MPPRDQRERAIRVEDDLGGRLPPGQVVTRAWPVLHHGEVPRVHLASWRLTVGGLVENPLTLTWEELSALPRQKRVNDVHCVTHWSKLDNEWEGVGVQELLRRAVPKPEARFVLQTAAGGYTTNLPLADVDREENLVATHHGGEPLSPEHGWPCRLVIPHVYFWKGAKWLTGLTLLAEDCPGFWERNGYHSRGDPFEEERFRDDW